MGKWFENADAQPLGRKLYLAHRVVRAELDARLSEHGASLWHWVLLREASFAAGASQRELAARMGIEPPTLVGQLDRFADDGYLERRRDDDDRRIIRIWLTPAGERRLAELHKIARAFDAELCSLLSERELETMNKALTRVQEHFGTPRDESAAP